MAQKRNFSNVVMCPCGCGLTVDEAKFWVSTIHESGYGMSKKEVKLKFRKVLLVKNIIKDILR